MAHLEAGEWRTLTGPEREAARAAWQDLLARLSPGHPLPRPGLTSTQKVLLLLFFAPFVAGLLGAESNLWALSWVAWIVVLLARNLNVIPH
jgi:hypothetical protein